MQAPILVVELRAARERVAAATRAHIDVLVLLADRVNESPHLYLRFVGD